MNENLKAFLENISKQKELAEELKGLTDNQEVIAFAKAHGFELTQEDLEVQETELSEDELDAVAGGGGCGCMVGGGGGGTDDVDGKTYGCACVAYGQGGDGRAMDFNCLCYAYGVGSDNPDA